MRLANQAARHTPLAVEEHRRSLRSMLAASYKGVDEAAALSGGSTERMEALRQLLSDHEPSIRRDAGWSLYQVMRRCRDPLPSAIILSLGTCLGDPDPNVRNASIHALSAYACSLEVAGVSRRVIAEALKPAMPFVKRYGYDRSPAERDIIG